MSNSPLSPGNIAKSVYNSTNESINVSLVGTGSPTMPNVVILSDGVGYMTSTVLGPKRGLDVNIINDLEINISHTEDSVRLGDGVDYITSTTVGAKKALDVSVQPLGTLKSKFFEILGVSANTETQINSYTAPLLGITRLTKVVVSGTNMSTYLLYINDVLEDKSYTSAVDFNYTFSFGEGLELAPSDVVSIKVIHNRPSNGDYNARIETREG
jgi:hypothetical protein